MLERQNIKCEIFQFNVFQVRHNLQEKIINNHGVWDGPYPIQNISQPNEVKIEDPDGYTYILKNKK